MATLDSFTTFVNTELPKRISTEDNPIEVVAGLVPVTTGVGLGVEFKDPKTEMPRGLSALEVLKEAFPEEFDGYYLSDEENMRRILTGEKGSDGVAGIDGKSALQILKEAFPEAFQNYYNTDEENMRDLLKGRDGEAGRGVIEELQAIYPEEFVIGDEETDQETMQRLLRGKDGSATHIVGTVETIEELPDAEGSEAAGHAYLVGKILYVPYMGEWIEIGDLSGPEGMGLRIKGTLPYIDALPVESNTAGDAYIINKKMFVWDTERWAETGNVGAPGQSAYEAALQTGFVGSKAEWVFSLKGEKGDKGDQGDRGLKGDAANALNVQGAVDSISQLPALGNSGDAFFIGKNLWVWNGDEWLDAGVYAPRSAHDIAVEHGFEGTEQQWLESLVGITGAQGPQGDKGEKGDKGDTSPGIRLLGPKDSVVDLPATAESFGDAYLIDGNSWVYGTDGWFDAGIFRGESGPQGEPGPVGPQGTTGPQLVVSGEVSTSGELPATIDTAVGVAYSIGSDVWIRGNNGWFNAGPLRGPEGKQGIQGPRGDKGEIGPRGYDGFRGPQGYTGAKGEKGDKGDLGLTGPVGKQLIIKGRVSAVPSLPIGASVGDAYLIDDHVWIWGADLAWFDAGILEGPVGPQGNEGPVGPAGPQGKALNLLGVQATIQDLPPETQEGFSWMVGENVYLKTATGYTNIGPIRGPQGVQGPIGATGAKGDIGNQGPGLKIMGKVATVDELPVAMPEYSMSYLVGERLYTYGGQGWVDMGIFGAVSAYEVAMSLIAPNLRPSEAEWVASLKGDKGEPGEKGESGQDGKGVNIVGSAATADALPTTGVTGDGMLVGVDLYVWDSTTWKNVGPIRGPKGDKGDKGDQGVEGRQGIQGLRGPKGERGSSLLLGDYDPTALDGTINDVWTNTVTQGVWLKSTNVLWTFIGNFGGGNVFSPSNDGLQYLRSGSEWVRFNHYDLNARATTGICDIGQSNVFTLDNKATGVKTVSFLSAPVGRAATVVVLVSGNVGTVNWPADIIWGNNTAPELGVLLTNVVLLWDGTRFIGTVGASA